MTKENTKKATQLKKIIKNIKQLPFTQKNAERLWTMWFEAPDEDIRTAIAENTLFSPGWNTAEDKRKGKKMDFIFWWNDMDQGFKNSLKKNTQMLQDPKNKKLLDKIVSLDTTGRYTLMLLDELYAFVITREYNYPVLAQLAEALIKKDKEGEFQARAVEILDPEKCSPVFKKESLALREKLETDILTEKKIKGALYLLKINIGKRLWTEAKEESIFRFIVSHDTTGEMCADIISSLRSYWNRPEYQQFAPLLFNTMHKKDADCSVTINLLSKLGYNSMITRDHKNIIATYLKSEQNRLVEKLIKNDPTGFQSVQLFLRNRNGDFAFGLLVDSLTFKQRCSLITSAIAKNTPLPSSVDILPLIWCAAAVEFSFASKTTQSTLAHEKDYWEREADNLLRRIFEGDVPEKDRPAMMARVMTQYIYLDGTDGTKNFHNKKFLGAAIKKKEWNKMMEKFFSADVDGDTAALLITNGSMGTLSSKNKAKLLDKILGRTARGASAFNINKTLGRIGGSNKRGGNKEMLVERLLEIGTGREIQKVFVKHKILTNIFCGCIKGALKRNPLLVKDISDENVSPFLAAILLLYGDIDPASPLRAPLIKQARAERRKTMERLYIRNIVPPARDFVRFLIDVHGNSKIANPDGLFAYESFKELEFKNIFAQLADELKENPDSETLRLFRGFLEGAGKSLCTVEELSGQEAKKEYFNVVGTLEIQGVSSEPEDEEQGEKSFPDMDVF